MPKFSKNSRDKLSTCDRRLQRLFGYVIKYIDCTVTDGFRSKDVQNALYKLKKTRTVYPYSKHNSLPSLAVDVAPFVNGDVSYDVRHCCYFAGIVLAIAAYHKIPIRWGGNWDMDEEIMTDQEFQDLVHFELIGD